MNIDTTTPVCVTGATGYVAGVLVKDLLDKGLAVHAAIRDPSKTDRLKYLTDIADASKGSIKFFKADLLEEGSYLEAIKGCSVVFHTASPFMTDVPKGKEQEMLLDPAVKGTKNVLKSCSEVESVKRVVLTSSMYAVCVDAQDTHDVEKCDESCWNTQASKDYNPYAFSKVLAEKAAWEFVKEDSVKYNLIVINPSFVMGPGLKAHPTSESFQFVQNIGNGLMKYGCPNFGLGVVDVRNVAEAHVNAAFMPEAEGRHIISGTNTNILSMCQAIKGYPDYPLPKNSAPKLLVRLLGPLMGMSRKSVKRSCDIEMKLDTTKSVEKLKITYIPLEKTMTEMFAQEIQYGLIKVP